jgi:hypothetical protein
VTGHVGAEGVELLGVPARADPRDDTVTTYERGQLGEVAQDERRVREAHVGHERAEPEAIRHGGDRREHDDRVVGAEGVRAVAAQREEEVIGEEDSINPDGVESRDS